MMSMLTTKATTSREFTPPKARSLLAGLFNAWCAFDARLRQRWALSEMPGERLADMGITGEAARREAAKPFWRA